MIKKNKIELLLLGHAMNRNATRTFALYVAFGLDWLLRIYCIIYYHVFRVTIKCGSN